MEPTIDTKEDPLIAALPPATDYMTYLTLLEYQLKPDNLATLNRLLSQDDGTLAAEIGWDLLKLVLPMLQIVPEDANKCLSIIARRGNPREVVVRVAEELERLGQREEEHENDELSEEEQDDLPTFAGEAPRIHLGKLTLDGMPPPKEQFRKRDSVDAPRSDRRASIDAEYGSDNILIFKALLSMLGILHPRIKTQYPSRFLATSLPAALGTYRCMPVTTETTIAFIEFLAKMSGKQRPALPPRVSTAQGIPTFAQQSTAPTTEQAAPLPDPEAKSEKSSTTLDARTNENAITLKLLQAVMLELLDEYTGSLQSTEQPSMSWTVRLREKHEPKRVLPQRPTETQRWTQSPTLKPRDEVIAIFLKLSNDLNLDIAKEINNMVNPVTVEASESNEASETDYPTSPSQIPFPTSGLILLYAARNFAEDRTSLTATGLPALPFEAIRSIFRLTFSPPEGMMVPNSLSQTDALLSLMYTTLQSPLSQLPTQPPTETPPSNSQIDLPMLTNLTNLFLTSPDANVRDSTHHITSLLLHNHTSTEVKLLYIKSLLSPNQSPASPIHEIQQGNLRAVAINWLKDEFLSYLTHPTDDTNTQIPPTQPPTIAASVSSANVGLDPNLLHTDLDLAPLIYPTLPAAPGPFISSQPGANTSASNNPMSSDTDLESLLLQIPAYVATLNLTYILATAAPTLPLPPPGPAQASSTTSTSDPHGHNTDEESILSGVSLQHAHRFLASVTAWRDLLLGLVKGIAQTEKGPLEVADVYALDDAVGRVGAVLPVGDE